MSRGLNQPIGNEMGAVGLLKGRCLRICLKGIKDVALRIKETHRLDARIGLLKKMQQLLGVLEVNKQLIKGDQGALPTDRRMVEIMGSLLEVRRGKKLQWLGHIITLM